ncbi:efflux RND transporter periplasmic adaptor subunit [Lactobacillaceae bacterium 24-114]
MKREKKSRKGLRLLAGKKRRRLIIIGSILGILVVGGIFLAITNRNQENKPTYNTLKVSQQADFVITGKVESVQKQVLSLPSGKVQQINVKNGDHVVSGEALLTTHNDETQDNVAELQGDLQKSQQTMQAQQQTINSIRQQLNGMSSGDEGYSELQSQLSEAQSAYSDAQASVNATQTRLNNSANKVNQTLTAPYSGYVMIDNTKQGDPVLTLYSDSLQFSGEVSEYDYAKLHNGTDLHVKALATNREETTPVSYLAGIPTKDSSNNNAKYQVTANLNANKFMNGQTAKASIAQEGVRIPKSAVKDGKAFVVDSKGYTRETKVTGHTVNSYYVVTDGVDEGDRIVTNPNSKLKNNMKVDKDD